MGMASGMYGERTGAYKVLGGSMRKRDHMEDLGAEVIRGDY
jgi:hypothetical protein